MLYRKYIYEGAVDYNFWLPYIHVYPVKHSNQLKKMHYLRAEVLIGLLYCIEHENI